MLSLETYSNRSDLNLEIIKGKYNIQPKEFYASKEPVDFTKMHRVWVAEEKQTDVAIAVDLLCNALDGKYDQAVIVSNDSDLAPALKKLKARWSNLTIGVIAPIRGKNRQPSSELKKLADWTRRGIKEIELELAQLPDRIVTRKRVITKPQHW